VHATAADLAAMDDVVRVMHTKSGLLPAIEASTVTLEEAGAATLEFLQGHISQKGAVPLCGNSIGTDRRFLARWLPDVESFLHYRSVDVSTVKELAKRWYPLRAWPSCVTTGMPSSARRMPKAAIWAKGES
jgi:oligoribonuclease